MRRPLNLTWLDNIVVIKRRGIMYIHGPWSGIINQGPVLLI